VQRVVSIQAEVLIDDKCYKMYWMHRTTKNVLVYVNTMMHGYESYTKTPENTVLTIEDFEKFCNNYEGEKWG
jgi:hypothetical protein